jgi:ADP-heptose:LPS heptosyltransferase
MLPRRNVLIFHSGALGDFILTWPLALALGRLFPQSRIFYVTHRQKGLLAERVLRVESVDVEGGWHPLYSESPAAPPALPEPAFNLLTRAHAVFTFMAGPDSPWTRNVARLAPEAQVVSLSQAPQGDFAGHLSDYLVAQLKPWPIYEQAVSQILRSIETRGLPTAAIAPAGDTPGVPILHPGSGSRHKCWPAEKFLELAHRLARDGLRPRIVVGDVEEDLWGPPEIDAFAAAGELHRPRDLLGLLDSYRGAGLFVGNDSGPGHLAGVLGLPTLVLFGPTDPTRWRPLGPKVRVIRRTPLEALSVDEVWEEMRDKV